MENITAGNHRLITSGCYGGPTTTIIGTDDRTAITYPDSPMVETVTGDPRFGLPGPIIKSMTVTTLGALKYIQEGSKKIGLANQGESIQHQDPK
ncbi:MAG: hypothetical protein K6U03_02220 [Firmicutes bacterium]|nr:hypothetical protein [Bacillota bacterium]